MSRVKTKIKELIIMATKTPEQLNIYAKLETAR